MNIMPKIGVIGGGAWGLSLGRHWHKLNRLEALYTSYGETCAHIRSQGTSPRLADAHFPIDFPITQDISAPLKARHILIACSMNNLSRHIKLLSTQYNNHDVILCCKGQDATTLALPHQIAAEHLPEKKLYLLSGPSFAHDLVHGRILAVCLAGQSLAITQPLAENLSTSHFRLYASDDRIGVALGGAYKNILAIAAGIGHGLGIGSSAEAALITRGLAEMQTICRSLGGLEQTLFGLSGLGDLILTASNRQSRNFRLGIALGKGKSPAQAIEELGAVAEGYHTVKCLPKMIEGRNLELPICEAIYKILYQSLAPETALQQLINRAGGKRENFS